MSLLHPTWTQDGKVLELRLDHGKANEMGSAALGEFEGLCETLERDPAVIALITWSDRVSTKGQPIFVAGADVTERVGWSTDKVKAHVRWQRQVLARLANAPVFHLCVVDGIALGWGTEYLLSADYAIATDRAIFGLPETGLGILPGAGGTSELQARVGPAHALRLGITGERIGADEAARIGLVQERASDLGTALDRARHLASLAASRSPTAVAVFKSALHAGRGQPEEPRRELEARAYEHCVESGEAAIGRKYFDAALRGEPIPWGPKRRP
jgi:enoyl-CoA hydratase/carnithine racemase